MATHDFDLLDQKRVREILHITQRTLERWRVTGTGPRFVRVGKRPLYRPDDLAAWLAAHTADSTSEESAVK
ncbi:MAG: helix-turn-helix transcriptional regulator [Acetobacteraceae bacterium]